MLNPNSYSLFHSINLQLGGYTYCWSSLPLYTDHHYLMLRSDFTQNSRKAKNESNDPHRLAVQPVPPGASSANPENG